MFPYRALTLTLEHLGTSFSSPFFSFPSPLSLASVSLRLRCTATRERKKKIKNKKKKVFIRWCDAENRTQPFQLAIVKAHWHLSFAILCAKRLFFRHFQSISLVYLRVPRTFAPRGENPGNLLAFVTGNLSILMEPSVSGVGVRPE